MSGIDWSQAPEGAMGHALIGQSFRPVWVGNDWYEYIGGGRHRFASDPDAFYAFARSALHDYAENPSVPAWTGAGLPPIGTVCEFKELGLETWIECTIIGMFRGEIVCGCNSTGAVGTIEADQLRPFRTPEQIAAEERAEAIEKMWSIYWQPHATSAKQALGLLWDAGLRLPDDSDNA